MPFIEELQAYLKKCKDNRKPAVIRMIYSNGNAIKNNRNNFRLCYDTMSIEFDYGSDYGSDTTRGYMLPFLRYYEGFVTVIPIRGDGVLSGQFSGCWFVKYNDNDNQLMAAHIGTGDSSVCENTINVKRTWINAVEGGNRMEVDNVLNCYHPYIINHEKCWAFMINNECYALDTIKYGNDYQFKELVGIRPLVSTSGGMLLNQFKRDIDPRRRRNTI